MSKLLDLLARMVDDFSMGEKIVRYCD